MSDPTYENAMAVLQMHDEATTRRRLEAEARALFEADPSSALEASWDQLASYKRGGWIQVALLQREYYQLRERIS